MYVLLLVFFFFFFRSIECSIFSIAIFVDMCIEKSVDQLMEVIFHLFTVRYT